MDTRTEIKEFLTSRRAKITPEQAGLTAYGSRRVPGLRREEVAVLAGVSVPYYTRLERGEVHGVSDSVLDALARALQLDEAERLHLFDLARAAQPTIAPRRRRPPKQQVRPSVQHILDAITGAAAFVRNDRLDILAANDSVAVLRASAGRDPYDRCLSDLVGELSTQSDEFRTRWAQHNVRQHITGIKHFHHPVVGELSLTYDRLDLLGADHLHLHRRARLA
jgi:transcriptional regulator with XRE-family HTH domain